MHSTCLIELYNKLWFPPSDLESSPLISSSRPPFLLIMEALIALTEALSWEDPSYQIETIPPAAVINESFPLIVHFTSQKIHNNQSVNATLIKAWDFAIPFSFSVIGPNKFILKFSKQEHIDKIHKQVTWNVIGCLLTLQNWSPTATMGEIST